MKGSGEMKVIRFHDRKGMALNRQTISLALVSWALLGIMTFYGDAITFIDVSNNYLGYFLGLTVVLNVLLFSLPFMIFKNTFESELVIEEHHIRFKDAGDMFPASFSKEDIMDVAVNGDEISIALKNKPKMFTFILKEGNAEDVKTKLTLVK